MMDSLPYRNDAAIVFRRLIRSLPRRRGVLGVATCDKGLPAMMMALAGSKQLAAVLVPGGVTLPPRDGEDAGKIQSIGARYAHGELTLPEAAELGCRACAAPAADASFWERQPHRRLSPKRWGSRCRTLLWRHPVSQSGARWLADRHARWSPWLIENSLSAMYSRRPRSRTPWSYTPRSAARPTCCFIYRPSPSPLD